MTELIPLSAFANWPTVIASAGPAAWHAILQFFAAEIRNANTRRAYLRAAQDFFVFAERRKGGTMLDTITSLHVSAWIEAMARDGLSAPTIKLRLAAIRMLFQALARERIVHINPASVVRGPKHSVKRGKTPVLTAEETRQLLDSIDTDTLVGLRDRALIATMVYSFARIGAVTTLRVEDLFTQGRRLWLRLHEKGGKRHEIPCHHTLEQYLIAYLEAADLGDTPKAFVFQTFGREGDRKSASRSLSGAPLPQATAWQMLQRRAKDAGIDTAVCNHTFRATGITTYLKNSGTLERAATIANHSSTRTTQLYDRRPDDVTLDEIEKIQI
jgi:site-specific recombinase XerD